MGKKLIRPRSRQLDGILGEELKVLDFGFVRVVDYMGDDQSVVQAARVSYGAGTKKVSEDRGLIRYLMRHGHTTPFEMCELKLHVKVPMDCWRQWIRHRTANVNEYSTRYSIAIDESSTTEPNRWRSQSSSSKQGSAGFLSTEIGRPLSQAEAEFLASARKVYEDRLELGVSREQARKDLPHSTFTEAYWKCDLHNLLHFLRLRLDDHAQYEIRSYARTIATIVEMWCPLTWEAFCDYSLSAERFTSLDLRLLEALIAGDSGLAIRKAIEMGWLTTDGKVSNVRELREFEAKVKRFSLTLPWRLEEPTLRPPEA